MVNRRSQRHKKQRIQKRTKKETKKEEQGPSSNIFWHACQIRLAKVVSIKSRSQKNENLRLVYRTESTDSNWRTVAETASWEVV